MRNFVLRALYVAGVLTTLSLLLILAMGGTPQNHYSLYVFATAGISTMMLLYCPLLVIIYFDLSALGKKLTSLDWQVLITLAIFTLVGIFSAVKMAIALYLVN